MLDRILQPVQPQIERFERRFTETLASDVNLVQAMGSHILTTKGKIIRPALSLLTAQAIGRCSDRVVDAAAGIEVIHTATLIHDDVIDLADKRRGAEVLNLRWGNKAAVLMGDFLLARALQLLVGLDSMDVMRAATRAVSRMIEGEILEEERGNDAEAARYFKMIDKKTASLMALSCEVGAILGGGTPEQVSRMSTFGQEVGIAFQITDDLLDFIGDEASLGKPVGTDVRERKLTLPLIRAIANCPNGDAEKIQAKVQNGIQSDAELQEVFRFVRRYHGIEAARREAREYASSGLESLAELKSSEARNALELAVRHVVDRRK
ncbi:MAG: polyprenyl synthetase family protein [Gemmatimonadota bacterium]|nr:polyprenyl synthetase family protein [Gemmatimonadota bacterium]